MLGRNNRISLAKFNKFGQRFKKDNLVIFVGSENVNVPKFAIVVPSKFCKKAVARNRTKRLIAESINRLKPKIKPAIYKILVCEDFSNQKFEQVFGKLETIFAKAGRFNLNGY